MKWPAFSDTQSHWSHVWVGELVYPVGRSSTWMGPCMLHWQQWPQTWSNYVCQQFNPCPINPSLICKMHNNAQAEGLASKFQREAVKVAVFPSLIKSTSAVNIPSTQPFNNDIEWTNKALAPGAAMELLDGTTRWHSFSPCMNKTLRLLINSRLTNCKLQPHGRSQIIRKT